jgi:transcriptional regulator with XRE-family HTH domain
MAKKFDELFKKMSPKAQAEVNRRVRELITQLPLYELRQARRLSQEQLAETLGVKQASISKLEHRTDMYVSSLRSYIQAMGGELEIIARFPDGAVQIKQFKEIEDKEQRATG